MENVNNEVEKKEKEMMAMEEEVVGEKVKKEVMW